MTTTAPAKSPRACRCPRHLRRTDQAHQILYTVCAACGRIHGYRETKRRQPAA